MLSVAAVVVAFFTVLYFSLFILFFGPFPKDMAEPTAGFLMGSALVLAGSLPAPRRQCISAVVIFVPATAVVGWVFNFHVIGSVVGGLFAVGFVAWWFHPNRTRRSTARVSLTIGATCLAFLGLVYLRYVDMPARPAELPPELVETLGANVARVAAFHRYDLGGFIDHEWLWRVDAPPDIVTLVISGLKMHKTDSVPPQLWRMPPYYWPRSMPPGGEAFESSGFSAENRGRDGEHYFLVHDKTQNKAFVWLKSNF